MMPSHARATPTRLALVVLAGCAALVAAAGCGAPPYRPLPYVPKAPMTPNPLVCHDAIGHIKANKPWILGGNCCCTPTPENYKRHVKHGTIPRATSYEQYLALYKQRDIVTDLDHKGCGNLCDHGPHVVMGGRCMATPTPGTAMYEQVTYGPHTQLIDGGKQPTDASQ